MVSIKFCHKTKTQFACCNCSDDFHRITEHSYTTVTRIPDKNKVTRKGVIKISNTVYTGFCDQPPSQASRSLNPMEVAKFSGFPLAIFAQSRLSPLGITTSTVAISLFSARGR